MLNIHIYFKIIIHQFQILILKILLEVCGRFNRGLTYDIYERISYEILDQPYSCRFIDYDGDERMLVYNIFKSIT